MIMCLYLHTSAAERQAFQLLFLCDKSMLLMEPDLETILPDENNLLFLEQFFLMYVFVNLLGN